MSATGRRARRHASAVWRASWGVTEAVAESVIG